MKTILLFFIITMSNSKCSELNKALIQDVSNCESHDQCPNSKACINGVCGDPCESLCGENTYCTTLQHIPACACREGHTGNPFISCNLQVTSGGQASKKKRYQILRTTSFDWMAAFAFCRRNNTWLLSIDNMAEFDEIMEYLRQSHAAGEGFHEFWTSGMDVGSEGNFIWSTTGKQLPSLSKMWRQTEPNDKEKKENCVNIAYVYKELYGLNDADCSRSYPVICEYYD